MLLPWFELAICAAVIAVAGTKLTKYGDAVARLSGLSRSRVGLVLLAAATSLPELFTGVSAVTLVDAPNIAVGDALGSCVFNLLLLVLMDGLIRDTPMYRVVDQGHILTAGFGVIMIGSFGALILLGREPLDLHVLHISGYTLLLIFVYFVAIWAAFDYARRSGPLQPVIETGPDLTLRSAILRYLGAAMVVTAAGSWPPFIGNGIITAMGWKPTFVGTILIAGTTSLPELVL